MSKTVRVACYGTGNFARKKHLITLKALPDVELVAFCDSNPETLAAAGKEFDVSALYTSHYDMLEKEKFDALFSIVPAYARTDCEILAARKGIHLFIEKPQAAKIEKAKEIDQAIRESGVLSTVGYRERFRPSLQAAREFMQEKLFLHVVFTTFYFIRQAPRWSNLFDQMGGPLMDWGGHFMDQVRYVTGADVTTVQAFLVDSPRKTARLDVPISYCASFRFNNGAVASYNCMASFQENAIPPAVSNLRQFLLGYDGGVLEIHNDLIKANGEVIYQSEATDPWVLSVEAFIEAVRTGDRSLIRNDFSDGLLSLGPILAAKHSGQHGGELVEMRKFMGPEPGA